MMMIKMAAGDTNSIEKVVISESKYMNRIAIIPADENVM